VQVVFTLFLTIVAEHVEFRPEFKREESAEQSGAGEDEGEGFAASF
jgi:hypothetical protein